MTEPRDIIDHPNFAAIEAERQAVFARIVAQQPLRKEFLQCLITPAVAPDASSLVPFDKARKPSDEQDDWTALLAMELDSGALCQYYVDRYNGPLGPGFIVGARVDYEAEIWCYEEHHGPEKRVATFGKWYTLDRDEDTMLEPTEGEKS